MPPQGVAIRGPNEIEDATGIIDDEVQAPSGIIDAQRVIPNFAAPPNATALPETLTSNVAQPLTQNLGVPSNATALAETLTGIDAQQVTPNLAAPPNAMALAETLTSNGDDTSSDGRSEPHQAAGVETRDLDVVAPLALIERMGWPFFRKGDWSADWKKGDTELQTKFQKIVDTMPDTSFLVVDMAAGKWPENQNFPQGRGVLHGWKPGGESRKFKWGDEPKRDESGAPHTYVLFDAQKIGKKSFTPGIVQVLLEQNVMDLSKDFAQTLWEKHNSVETKDVVSTIVFSFVYDGLFSGDYPIYGKFVLESDGATKWINGEWVLTGLPKGNRKERVPQWEMPMIMKNPGGKKTPMREWKLQQRFPPFGRYHFVKAQ